MTSLGKLVCGQISPFLKFNPYISHFIAPRSAVSFHCCSPLHSIEYGGCVKIINIRLKPAPAWVHYQWAVTQRGAGILSNKLACRSLFTPTLSRIRTWSKLSCQRMTFEKPAVSEQKLHEGLRFSVITHTFVKHWLTITKYNVTWWAWSFMQ